MKVYVKSAGRKAAQDYVWKAVEAFGADDKAEREILSIAERSTANKGRVASFVGNAGELPCRFALFFGNIDSGRCDFYGTPILNRIGFVFDGGNSDDVRLALNLTSDWYSASSALERLIATGIIASDDEIGFSLASDFAEVIRKIALSPPVEKMRPDADQGVFESIARIGHLHPPVYRTDKPKDNSKQKGNSMKIYINTLPSGGLDYGWYIGGRPRYADRLYSVCEHTEAISAECTFFAALSKEGSDWVVFVQDIIGTDMGTVRPAQGTVAIEIPDSGQNALDKAKRLLCSWLHPKGRLLKTVKENVDISGDAVKADMPALLAAVEKIGADSSISLGNAPQPQNRTIRRISQSRDNVDSLRSDAAKFVAEHSFSAESGVQFLFTNFAYSSRADSYDALPGIPAKYIVAGYREDELADINIPNDDHPVQPPPPPPYLRMLLIALGTIIVIAVSVLLLTLRGCNKSTKGTDDKGCSVSISTNAVSGAATK